MINRVGNINGMAILNHSAINFRGRNSHNKENNKYYANTDITNTLEQDTFETTKSKNTDKILLAEFVAGLSALQAIGFAIADYYSSENFGKPENYATINLNEKNELPELAEFEINGKKYTVLGETKESYFEKQFEPKQQKKYFKMPEKNIPEPVLPQGTLQGVLKGKESELEQICAKYGVEPKFIAALIGAETGWGTSGVASQNNPMSYRSSGDLGKDSAGFGIFSTPEAGLEKGIKNIARYRDEYGVGAIDINHVDEIGDIYCEGSSWANFVRECYNSIE